MKEKTKNTLGNVFFTAVFIAIFFGAVFLPIQTHPTYKERIQKETRNSLLIEITESVDRAAKNGKAEYCFNTSWHSQQVIDSISNFYIKNYFKVYYKPSEDKDYINLCINWEE